MRIAVFSDIHANLVALDAVLADARGRAGGVDAIWHLGDVVGYGPDPNGVVARLRDVGAIGVRGNHDAAAVGGNEIDWFNPDARKAMEWTRTALGDETRTWLADLPDRRTERGAELVHGSPRQPIWEYVMTPGSARANLDRLEAGTGLHGHTHVPVLWRDADGGVELVRAADRASVTLDDRRALVNPGSVGQPRDGIPTASYLVLDLGSAEAVGPGTTVTWRRVAYDIEAVQRAMRAVHLPGFLVRRLELGA
jgi:diadenosine tetraphosphatase ApaH/serine/threonine PP2A family protein phosphatase